MSAWVGWFRPEGGRWRPVSSSDTPGKAGYDEARAGLGDLERPGRGDCAVMLAGSSPQACCDHPARWRRCKSRQTKGRARVLAALGLCDRTTEEVATSAALSRQTALEYLTALEVAGRAVRTRRGGPLGADLWRRAVCDE